MRTVSNDFLTELNANGRKIKVKLMYNNADIDAEIKSAVLEYGCNENSESITIGSAVSAKLEMTLITNEDLLNKELEYYIGLEVSGNYSYVKMGIFKIDSFKKVNDVMLFVAYDKMYYYCNNTYNWTQSNAFSTQVNHRLTDLGTYPQLGTITLKGYSSSDTNYSLYFTKYTGTFRDYISKLSGCMGGYAYFDSNGNLTFAKFDSGSTITVSADKTYSLEIGNGFTINSLEAYVSDYQTSTSGSGQGIKISNPWMGYTTCDYVFEHFLKNKSYTAGNICMQGDMRIEPCDVLSITDIHNNVFKLYCMNVRQIYDGGLVTEVECYAETETATDTNYVSESQQVYQKLTDLLTPSSCYMHRDDTHSSYFNTYIKDYDEQGDDNVQVVKTGYTCELRGTCTNTQAISGTNGASYTLFTLPSEYRPKSTVRTICQGSGINRYLLTINTNGEVVLARYGASSYIAVPAGAWLTLNAIYTLK
jgi:hypothetical protein